MRKLIDSLPAWFKKNGPSRVNRPGIDEHGREVLDETPVVIALRKKRQTVDDMRLAMQAISASAERLGLETEEEANDFDLEALHRLHPEHYSPFQLATDAEIERFAQHLLKFGKASNAEGDQDPQSLQDVSNPAGKGAEGAPAAPQPPAK